MNSWDSFKTCVISLNKPKVNFDNTNGVYIFHLIIFYKCINIDFLDPTYHVIFTHNNTTVDCNLKQGKKSENTQTLKFTRPHVNHSTTTPRCKVDVLSSISRGLGNLSRAKSPLALNISVVYLTTLMLLSKMYASEICFSASWKFACHLALVLSA